MNKKIFLNLLSIYGMTFISSVKNVENQKSDYDDEVIVNVDTMQLLKHDEMNVFCEGCMS